MRPHWIIALLLIVVTVAVYARVANHEFIGLDDDRYVTQNPQVQAGLTSEGFRWAWTTFHASNWHPLTWLSHMLDCEWFGLSPRGPHLTNVALHLANTLILFGLWAAMTRTVKRAAFVAALFALHPLHVESVAWVAERKDLLCALFGLLAIAAYVNWTRRGGVSRYGLVVLLFAAGLASKPMLVTLPVLLLLLDVWPLERLDPAGPRRTLARRVVEKAPLFALAAVSSAVTVVAQRGGGAVSAIDSVTLANRLANAAVSYVAYLGKLILPRDLSVIYPHPNMPGGTPWSAWQIVGSAVLLLLISIAVIRSRRGYLCVGWAWYLVALLPVIGLVQVGSQAMADRYTYLPAIGLFVAVSWGGVEGLSRTIGGRRGRAVVVALGIGATVGCAIASHTQLGYWKNSRSLFEHSLRAAPGSPTLHNDLGIALARDGDHAEAVHEFRAALEIVPDYPEAQFNLGSALVRLQRFDEAIEPLRSVLRSYPGHPFAHNELATALERTGHLTEAVFHYREAMGGAPDWIVPMNAAAWILATHPDPGERDVAGALRLARRAAELTRGKDPAVLDTWAVALAAAGRFDNAAEVATRAVELSESRGDSRQAAAIRSRLALYRNGVAYSGDAFAR